MLIVACLLTLFAAASAVRALGRRSRVVGRIEQTWSDLWMG
jgi:hypothetical protein